MTQDLDYELKIPVLLFKEEAKYRPDLSTEMSS